MYKKGGPIPRRGGEGFLSMMIQDESDEMNSLHVKSPTRITTSSESESCGVPRPHVHKDKSAVALSVVGTVYNTISLRDGEDIGRPCEWGSVAIQFPGSSTFHNTLVDAGKGGYDFGAGRLDNRPRLSLLAANLPDVADAPNIRTEIDT